MADEGLADGWGSSEPDDDTLVRAGVRSLAARVRHQARSVGVPLVDNGTVVAAALASSGMFSNAMLVVRPPGDWQAVVAALKALAPAGTPRLLVSPLPTPDLSADGLHLVGHPPFMVRPAGGDGPRTPEGVSIREVTDGDSLAEFERTLIEAYPVADMDPAAAPTLFPPAYLGGDGRVFAAFVDERMVATAAAHIAAGVNHVEFVSTRAEYRGRGIGAAVTWAATVADPSLPAVLISSDDGRDVYGALGYLSVIRWTLWIAVS
jgi:GNAT superfamily N-acetyltransferase